MTPIGRRAIIKIIKFDVKTFSTSFLPKSLGVKLTVICASSKRKHFHNDSELGRASLLAQTPVKPLSQSSGEETICNRMTSLCEFLSDAQPLQSSRMHLVVQHADDLRDHLTPCWLVWRDHIKMSCFLQQTHVQHFAFCLCCSNERQAHMRR
jgi:hypothetical protein